MYKNKDKIFDDFHELVRWFKPLLAENQNNLVNLSKAFFAALSNFESIYGEIDSKVNFGRLFLQEGYWLVKSLKSHFPTFVNVTDKDKPEETEFEEIQCPNFVPNCRLAKEYAEDMGFEEYSLLDIEFGSPLLPVDLIGQFADEMGFRQKGKNPISWVHTGLFFENLQKSEYRKQFVVPVGYGDVRTRSVNWADFITKVLNRSLPNYTVTINGVESQEASDIINDQVKAEAERLRRSFHRWLWDDPIKGLKLTREINERIREAKPVVKDFYTTGWDFPGTNPMYSLKWYQQGLVAKILNATDGGMLGAHSVGMGKTFALIGACMEGKRRGLKRPIISVQNNTFDQFCANCRELYPLGDFVEMRAIPKPAIADVLERLSWNDFDALIISHSVLESVIKEFGGRIEEGYSPFEFSDLFLVDEVHEFKTVPFRTKQGNIKGLPFVTTSGKIKKTRAYYFDIHARNFIKLGKKFAGVTGTPVSNTIAEIYIWQQMFAPATMKSLGLESFDAWCHAFAVPVVESEMTVGKGFVTKTRYKQFINRRLMNYLLGVMADVKLNLDPKLAQIDIPECQTVDVRCEQAESQKRILSALYRRANDIHLKRPQLFEKSDGTWTRDNMLMITGEIVSAAISPTFWKHDNYSESPSSKMAQCAQMVAQVYRATEPVRGCQMVFLDRGTPNGNPECLYYQFRDLCILMGVHPDEIAIVHDIDKQELVDAMNSGAIRVAIGSTGKLGTGTSAHLHGLWVAHHIDLPWSLEKIEQRGGRIIRPGNGRNYIPLQKVWNIRYYVEGFDGPKLTALDAKAETLSAFLRGLGDDDVEEEDFDNALSFSQIKAMATGNSLLPRFETARRNFNKYSAMRTEYKNQLRLLPSRIKTQEKQIGIYRSAIANIQAGLGVAPDFSRIDQRVFDYIRIEKTKNDGKPMRGPSLGGNFRLDLDRHKSIVISWIDDKGDLLYQYPSSMDYGVKITTQSIKHLKTSLDKWFDGREKFLEKTKGKLRAAVAGLESLKSEREDEFKQEELYQEAKAEVEQLSQEIQNLETMKRFDVAITEFSEVVKRWTLEAIASHLQNEWTDLSGDDIRKQVVSDISLEVQRLLVQAEETVIQGKPQPVNSQMSA